MTITRADTSVVIQPFDEQERLPTALDRLDSGRDVVLAPDGEGVVSDDGSIERVQRAGRRVVEHPDGRTHGAGSPERHVRDAVATRPNPARLRRHLPLAAGSSLPDSGPSFTARVRPRL